MKTFKNDLRHINLQVLIVIKQFTKKAKIDFNFWYDVEFDSKFNYFNFVKDVTNVINGTIKT